VGQPDEDRAGEDAQGSLGSALTSPRSRDHPGGGGRSVPCPRGRAAPEAPASSLRDDGRSGPLGGDRDRTVPSPLEVQCRVAQEIGGSTYLWLPSRLLPMLPNEGTKKL
jgi:hypothetical protein